MGRQFITRTQIDELAERGETRLEVDPRTTVTDLARERARERGVTLVTADRAVTDWADTGDDERLRAAVRSAVLAALGEAPADLDDVIDRVLRAQDGGRS
jgi:hypothetical protein